MAQIDYEWVKSEHPIRFSEYAADMGINLRTLSYDNVKSDIWDWIDSKVRNNILKDLDEIWEDKSSSLLSSVKQGIYVITIADNLSIDYDGEPSKVLYIGRGQLRSRINSHLKYWLKHLSDSLQDISIHIWMTEIKVKGNKSAYKEVETDLLCYFHERFSVYPLQNAKSGDYHEKYHDYCSSWNLPLRNPSNINQGWSIKPLEGNPWYLEIPVYD
ncbi:hypothetical protein [Photobacterium carnosum]|jgi:hypothetical protein|uniref:hypothetical protein n=1 Tax=Photobacterium carnosum TaxID=2023717 RepID=UPI001E5A826B|nr:hypothetical protein [Photobacterium carnosum]MCD9495803.1 hypothetical protein [Photobacterium carnosum]MCD9514762.1 hypothetical protein [Photobacterium carnosum]MCD9521795.1 hypothetical protein [Photobacterium carnosum]MCD9531776.1 hypothetical protein [Photobacterium carnosum]MCD9536935.1 hypothetical protein [Photobacterium carnosum]